MKRILAAALCVLLLLSGCSAMFNREVYRTSPHLKQQSEDADTTSLRASNAQGLEAALLRLVRAHSEEDSIRLTGYTGDVTRDLLVSIENVRGEPIGAYAVNNITIVDRTPMLTDEVITFYITYRRTKEQMDNLQYVAGAGALQNTLRQMLADYQDKLVIDIPYYDSDMMDLEVMLSDIYYQNPPFALGIPQLNYTLYPDNGLHRIIEINLTYPRFLQSRAYLAASAETQMQTLLQDKPDTQDKPALALWLHNRLAAHIDYDAETAQTASDNGGAVIRGSAYTVYGAFVNRLAVGEGYALAYKWLCDANDIPCQVVVGKRDGADHAWNLVKLDGSWYHVDAASDDMELSITYDWFLQPDEVMRSRYHWTKELPACEDTQLSFAVIAEAAFPALYEQWLAARAQELLPEGQETAAVGAEGEIT